MSQLHRGNRVEVEDEVYRKIQQMLLHKMEPSEQQTLIDGASV